MDALARSNDRPCREQPRRRHAADYEARNGDGARAQGGSLRAIAHGPRAWCTQAVDAHHARRWQVYVAGGYSVKLP